MSSTETASNKIVFTDLHEAFKKTMLGNTEKIIIEAGLIKGKIYFENYYNNTAKPWFHNKNLPRDHIVMINRCRSNHYHLAASLARMNTVDSSK